MGLKDDGQPAGLHITDDDQVRYLNWLKDGNILPPPSGTVEKFSLTGGDLLVVTVHPSHSTPVRFKNRCWIRRGPQKQLATPQDETLLNEKRVVYLPNFDMQPHPEAQLDDLDLLLFKSTYLPAAIAPETIAANNRTVEEQLAGLRLYVQRAGIRHPSNAGMLLLAKNLPYFFPMASVQYLRIDGDVPGDSVLEEHMFTDNLVETLAQVDRFLRNLIVTRPVRIPDTFRDENPANYPSKAMRELAMNAIAHRSYEMQMFTRINHYRSKIEFINPGGVMGGHQNDIMLGVSYPRNPILMEALHLLGYVNRFGYGLAMVKQVLERNGSPALQLEIDNESIFRATLHIHPAFA